MATARAGNVIGGGDWASDRLIPDCVKALLNGEEILIRNPQAIRPWQHVLEPLSRVPDAGGKIIPGRFPLCRRAGISALMTTTPGRWSGSCNGCAKSGGQKPDTAWTRGSIPMRRII